MQLTFPFRNLTINALLEFFEMGRIKEFSEVNFDDKEWEEGMFGWQVKYYHDRIPDFESELIQVIDTTGQETIDSYFEELAGDFHYIKTLLSKDELIGKINARNEAELEKFNAQVKAREEEFKNSPDRKRKHLESYEYTFGIGALIPVYGPDARKRTVIKTNYNFYCIEEKVDYVDPAIAEKYLSFLTEQSNLLFDIGRKYGVPWHEGKIKSKVKGIVDLKPILFCEGDIDVVLISKAAEVLGKIDLISKIELRHRASCSNLDKLWGILTDNNWETVPQKKVLLYDCDTGRSDEDFGHFHRRTIPKQEEHIVKRGIENLFPNATIERALKFKKEFVDFKRISGTERGIPYEKEENIINKHEKRNFSNWIIANGSAEDFIHFNVIFELLEKILS